VIRVQFLQPLDNLKIDAYVDMDFGCRWGFEDKEDLDCVKNQSGYVIFLADCPCTWVSSL
jgi:hypothetical protein